MSIWLVVGLVIGIPVGLALLAWLTLVGLSAIVNAMFRS